MPSRMALTDYTTPTSVSFRYSPLMSAMTCSAGQRSAGSECRDDETSLSGTIAGPQSSDPSGQHQAGLIAGPGLCGFAAGARGAPPSFQRGGEGAFSFDRSLFGTPFGHSPPETWETLCFLRPLFAPSWGPQRPPHPRP